MNDSFKKWWIVALLISMALAGETSGLQAQDDPPSGPRAIDLDALEPITGEEDYFAGLNR